MHTSALFTLISCAFAAPLIRIPSPDAIAGKWIVKLKGDVTALAENDLKASISSKPDFEYSMSGFRGFASTLSDEDLTRLQASNHVEYIEQDTKVLVSANVQQGNATWGLGRISHVEPGSATYVYDSSAGEGTCAYVIDTGIEVEHPEFQGRAEFLVDYSGEDTMKDGAGHGTHVAGTIGSVTWGVAKKTTLFAVRVLNSDGSGTNSGVLAGMNYVVTDAASRAEQCPNGFVANMSLGGRKVKAINDAAAAIVASGIFLGVAAGNEGAPADNVSPASEPTVCTVGATTPNDTLTAWSNYGPLVDILAPGLDITSTWIGGGINTIDGTSMATPHVVGLAAYLLGLGAPAQGLCETIAALANKDKVDPATLHNNTVSLLAYNHAEEMTTKYGRRRV